MELTDSSGRRINYLRLSVTDSCNFRCRYCMPANGVPRLAHSDILRYEELELIARTAVGLGIEKIRVTGGEPLVRKGVVDFLSTLAAIPGLKRLVLTTNGSHLVELAGELRCAGVESLNISIDSLRPATFARITRGGELKQVLAGLAAAEEAGFPFLKINVVVMRGVNDEELFDFVDLVRERPFHVRFIEYMPVTEEPGWQALSVSGSEILKRLSACFRIEPMEKETLAGPARNYRVEGSVGSIGIITPVSSHFCSDCNRIRVTSTGMAKGCLFSGTVTDLRFFLKRGGESELAAALRRVVGCKPVQHVLSGEGSDHVAFTMAEVGG